MTTDKTYLDLYQFATLWIKSQYRTFTSEDLKIAFFKQYPEANIHYNSFGKLMQELHRNKLIKIKDTTSAILPLSHGRLIRVWLTVHYSEIQRAKRELPETKANRESQIEIII